MFSRRHRFGPLPDLNWVDYQVHSGLGAAAQGVWAARHAARQARRAAWTARRRAGSSVAAMFIAGLAVVAFVKLISALQSGRRSTLEKIMLGALLLWVGAIVMAFRNRARA